MAFRMLLFGKIRYLTIFYRPLPKMSQSFDIRRQSMRWNVLAAFAMSAMAQVEQLNWTKREHFSVSH